MMITERGSTTSMLATRKSSTPESGSTTAKNPSTTTTTTEEAVVYLNGNYSFWPMENNAVDIISGLYGEGANSPTYVTPGITGSGYALKLIRTSKQYIKIPSIKSFAGVSFTVEMWIYPTTLINGDHFFGLFTQYTRSSKDYSLQMMIRGLKLSLDFYGGGIDGATSLTTNTWYHAAFVYDYPSKTQTVYLNGYQDGSHSSAGPYLGTGSSINIGMHQDGTSYDYFDGYIDQVSLTMAVNSADDILDDATLASWYSFDYEITYDSGPNKLQGKAVDLTLASGKVDQGLNFSLNSSFYQIPGYVLLGVKSSSFSMSLWVQRTSTGGGTLVHYSTQTDGQGWCIVPIGFSSAGNIIATAWAPDNQVTGPVLSVNTWTHVATTYSQTDGLTLYVNGVYVGSTAPQSNDAPGTSVILTLGNSLGGGRCNSKSIVTGTFSGYIDEFRVYSRELSAREVSALTKDKTCIDGIMNENETDIDCGGSCLTCAVGKNCTLTKDCNNVQCVNDICASATCNDTITNNGETDVDCGGSNCSPCGTGKACSGAGDCAIKSCVSSTCKNKTCSDGIMNGDETDIDCGGLVCPTCALYQMCKVDQDCSTGSSNISCIDGYCQRASCNSSWSTTGITLFSSSTRLTCTRMFIDSNDTLYGADKDRHYIWKLSKNAENAIIVAGVYESAGSDSAKLHYPEDVYVDRYGSIYVVDTNNQRIQKFINGTTHGITIAGQTGLGGCSLNRLYYPRGFAFDPTDTFMYIADRSCHRVVRFSTNSISGTDGIVVAGTGRSDNTIETLNGPYNIRYLSSINNDLLIVNWDGHSVIRWTLDATSGTFVAGLPGISCSNSVCLFEPADVRIDANLNMYVVDEKNHRVQMFCENSHVGVTIFGNGVAGDSSTQLNSPRGITFDSAMNMYVCDTGNKRVQKFLKL
ncbi:unnamed protein product [Adineta steineri]|uniref:LamG-like jellyroll fold domain-containing protein n=1 Tax=Adineta steineri TaxID=433720 RepID=A0A814XHC0_9BILA|nr:unnamed protein product [Adineta steineri]CAF1249641.1 unnamed protein product [Adineta steineri]